MQVVYLSDIFEESGKILDPEYLRKRPSQEKWSNLTFPLEYPLLNIFACGEMPSTRSSMWTALWTSGEILLISPKIWELRIDEDRSYDVGIEDPIDGLSSNATCPYSKGERSVASTAPGQKLYSLLVFLLPRYQRSPSNHS